MRNDLEKRDICIVGGGMVGSALALGLAKLGLQVTIIEKHLPIEYDPAQGPDIRVSAISAQSEKLLNSLGAWANIQSMRTCAYRRLSVWEREDCRTDFNASDLHHTHLGHIIENRLVQLGIHHAIGLFNNVEWVTAQSLKHIDFGEPARLTFENGETISADLVVAADGANSFVRQLACIGTHGWQYQQKAMGILIKTHTQQQDITWQKFTPQGPLAFLPLYDGYASLVWYGDDSQIKTLSTLNDDKLKDHIIQHFPDELVDFDVIDKASFPLTRMHANQYVKNNLVLVGDAAHTINPLAGQGVNLGFKDVGLLLTCIQEALEKGYPLSQTHYLDKYQRTRKADNLLMMSAMDGLYTLFSNDNTLLTGIRNLGLKIADKSGPLKVQVMKYAMGI